MTNSYTKNDVNDECAPESATNNKQPNSAEMKANGFVTEKSLSNKYPRELRIAANGEKFYRELTHMNMCLIAKLELPSLEERLAMSSHVMLYDLTMELAEEAESSVNGDNQSDKVKKPESDVPSQTTSVQNTANGKAEKNATENASEPTLEIGIGNSVNGNLAEGEVTKEIDPRVIRAEELLAKLDIYMRLDAVGNKEDSADASSTTAVNEYPLNKGSRYAKIRVPTPPQTHRPPKPILPNSCREHYKKALDESLHETTQTLPTDSEVELNKKFEDYLPVWLHGYDLSKAVIIIMAIATMCYLLYILFFDVNEHLNMKWHYQRLITKSGFFMKIIYCITLILL